MPLEAIKKASDASRQDGRGLGLGSSVEYMELPLWVPDQYGPNPNGAASSKRHTARPTVHVT
jgi:hypothetical protein